MSDTMSPAEFLAEEGRILELEAQRDAMPQAGANGLTPRNQLTLQIADMRAALEARRQAAPPQESLETIEARLQSRQRVQNLRSAVNTELAAAPEGSPDALRAIDDLQTIARAQAAADPQPDPMDVGWDTYDRALVEWYDSERALFKTIFRAAGVDPAWGTRLGSAWAAGPEDQETDFRAAWGQDFETNDAIFAEFAAPIPAAIRNKYITPTIKRRPQFVAEVLNYARSRAR